jgi:hypothetical protein
MLVHSINSDITINNIDDFINLSTINSSLLIIVIFLNAVTSGKNCRKNEGFAGVGSQRQQGLCLLSAAIYGLPFHFIYF